MLPAIIQSTGRPQKGIGDVQNKFIAYFNEAKKINVCETPRVLLIGPSIFNIEQIAVNYRGRNSICNNVLQALDVCYKSYWIFDIPYPEIAKNVYIFIQEFFYGTTTTQTKSPDGKKYFEYLKKFI